MKNIFQTAILLLIIFLSVLQGVTQNSTTPANQTNPIIEQNQIMNQSPNMRSSSPPQLTTKTFKTTHGFSVIQIHIPDNKPLAAAAIDDGTIYIGGGFGSYDFYAIDANTGNLKWHYRSKDDGPTAGIIHNGKVIFNTESCTIEVLDKQSGKSIWSKWLGDPLLSQPAAWKEIVYMVYPDNKTGSHMIIALAIEDGKEIWKQPLSGDAISAPVISDGTVYISTLDGNTYAFTADSGKLIWKREEKATSAPWIWSKKIFVSHRAEKDNKINERVSVSMSQSGDKGSNVKSYAQNDNAKYFDPKTQNSETNKALDSSVGFGTAPPSAKLNEASKVQGINSISGAWGYQGSRPIVIKGNSYVSMDNILEKNNPITGKQLWKINLKPKANYTGRFLTPPIITKDIIFIGTMDGEIIAINQKDGKTLWTISVGTSIQSQLTLDNGKLVATTVQGDILVVNLNDKTLSGWNMWGGNAQHNK